MKAPTLTQNQKLILSFIASTAAGAASAGIAAVVQSYTAQGLDIPVLINVGLIAFGAFFGSALYNFVPGHIQQVLAASADTAAMLQSNLQQLSQQHAALTQTVQVLAQTAQKQAVQAAQPVNVNVAQPTGKVNWMLDVPPNTTASVQPTPLQGVQQIPFPPSALPARPVSPQAMPVVKPVDVSQQDTTYQSVILPPDLHFGDSTVMPTVGQ